MTDSSASWSEDLTEEAAQIADDSLIVRARFIEAADTMAYVDVRMVRPGQMRTAWPAFQAETGTVGGHAPGYGINGDRVRYRPSSAAISRAEEVMHRWLAVHIVDDSTRIIVVNWSACLAVPHLAGSFRAFCKKRGLSRSTAERRLFAAFSNVASGLRKSALTLHEPDWPRVVPRLPFSATELDRIRKDAPPSPTSWMAPGARPVHQPEIHEVEKPRQRQQARA
jgi:hypothetical protein